MAQRRKRLPSPRVGTTVGSSPDAGPRVANAVLALVGSVIALTPVLLGQRPIVEDPFMLSQEASSHPDWIRALVAQIQARRFPVVVLELSAARGSAWYQSHPPVFDLPVVQAVNNSYRLAGRVDGLYVYTPRAS